MIDSETVQMIGRAYGLSADDLATVKIVQGPRAGFLQIYQVGASDSACRVLLAPLESFLKGRNDGHTKAFLLMALTNKPSASGISDPGLLAIVKERPDIPVILLKRIDAGIVTNRAGQISSRRTTSTILDGTAKTNVATTVPAENEVSRWVAYVAVDGDIAWRYTVRFQPRGLLDYVREEKQDAKDYDPKYEKTIKDVEAEVTLEMKRKGSYSRLGSINLFWGLVKQRLKAKGIDWLSPGELNSNTNYD